MHSYEPINTQQENQTKPINMRKSILKGKKMLETRRETPMSTAEKESNRQSPQTPESELPKSLRLKLVLDDGLKC